MRNWTIENMCDLRNIELDYKIAGLDMPDYSTARVIYAEELGVRILDKLELKAINEDVNAEILDAIIEEHKACGGCYVLGLRLRRT